MIPVSLREWWLYSHVVPYCEGDCFCEIIYIAEHRGYVGAIFVGGPQPIHRLRHVKIRVNVKVLGIEVAGEVLQGPVILDAQADSDLRQQIEHHRARDRVESNRSVDLIADHGIGYSNHQR